MKAKAYAKVNLFLRISGKRKDGYHNIESLMQSIDLSDDLKIEKSRSNCLITVKCKNADIPLKDNLVYKAAKLFKDMAEIKEGIRITLVKNVPTGAGLGGGSSDAASVLKSLNAMFNHPLSKAKLVKAAASLGSDVPFFLFGGLALAKGRGEKITQLNINIPLWLVLVKPSVHVSTPWAYNSFDKFKKNKLTRYLGYNRIIRQIKGGDAGIIKSIGFNDFESVISQNFPVIPKIKNELINAGALAVGMTGSGSTMYGVEFCKEKAQNIYRVLKGNSGKWWVCLTRTMPSEKAQ